MVHNASNACLTSTLSRMPLLLLAALVLLGLSGPAAAADDEKSSDRPNVLFIAVDDLRPQLNCYGKDFMHSPNIDRLAERGTMFRRAFCMVPTCGASRASLMSGIRPARNRFVGYRARVDEDAPHAVTLNTHFKKHGYHTVSLGKIFHYPEDNAHGWSEEPWRPSQRYMAYQNPDSLEKWEQHKQKDGPGGRTRGPAYEWAEVDDDAYPDGKLANEALSRMRRLADQEQPFFLAVGFFRPHLPFMAPKKYWDLYDRDEIRIPDNFHAPKNAPDTALHSFGELRAYAGIPHKGQVSKETARNLIHGYYASVSYTDAHVGKLLDELDRLGLSENTIIVLWGDHGWQLGEHGLWCKHCTFETSMHAPLIVSSPDTPAGRATDGLTEFIDIYPSLCDLAGLPKPDQLQGRSFAPLMHDPDRSWKRFAIGRFRNGDTIRTDRYRYSEYSRQQGRGNGKVFADMLYDHENDPRENVNIADKPRHESLVERLSNTLNQHMGRPFDESEQ